MKVVIDTNILINASNDESSIAYRIIKEVIEGRVEAYASHQTMGENRQMLRKLVRDREYRQLLEDYFSRLNIVKPYQKLEIVSDEEDNKLFESAAASNADYLITKDQLVLDVEKFRNTLVVTPEDFWAKYQNSEEDSTWQNWSKMLLGN